APRRAAAGLYGAADDARDVQRDVRPGLRRTGGRREDVLRERAEADAAEDRLVPPGDAGRAVVERVAGDHARVHAHARLATDAPVARAARGNGRQDDGIARCESGNLRSDRLDDAGG